MKFYKRMGEQCQGVIHSRPLIPFEPEQSYETYFFEMDPDTVLHRTAHLIAASMGAYTAIRLTEIVSVKNLVLLVPAAYTPRAYHLPFGPAFSAAIRIPCSWKESDAYPILENFKGKRDAAKIFPWNRPLGRATR